MDTDKDGLLSSSDLQAAFAAHGKNIGGGEAQRQEPLPLHLRAACRAQIPPATTARRTWRPTNRVLLCRALCLKTAATMKSRPSATTRRGTASRMYLCSPSQWTERLVWPRISRNTPKPSSVAAVSALQPTILLFTSILTLIRIKSCEMALHAGLICT